MEALWNELYHSTHPFSLFCAYPMHGFAGEGYVEQFTEICQQHSHVIPDESYTLLASPDERLRAITLLQQKATSLQAEIAERKVAEERLRISETRYRRLFEASTDGILMIDPLTSTITDANPVMTELLGYTHEQLLGQELWHIGLFGDRQATLSVLRELQEKRFLRYETLPLHTKDGQPCHVAIMIWQSDTTGVCIYVNTTWCRFTGLSEEESLGAGRTSAIHPEDRDAASTLWMQVFATRTSYQTQFRLQRTGLKAPVFQAGDEKPYLLGRDGCGAKTT